jgi:hypothetical protein
MAALATHYPGTWICTQEGTAVSNHYLVQRAIGISLLLSMVTSAMTHVLVFECVASPACAQESHYRL